MITQEMRTKLNAPGEGITSSAADLFKLQQGIDKFGKNLDKIKQYVFPHLTEDQIINIWNDLNIFNKHN